MPVTPVPTFMCVVMARFENKQKTPDYKYIFVYKYEPLWFEGGCETHLLLWLPIGNQNQSSTSSTGSGLA